MKPEWTEVPSIHSINPKILQSPNAEGTHPFRRSLRVSFWEKPMKGIWSYIQGFRHGIRDMMLLVIPQGVKAGTGLASSILLARGLGPGDRDRCPGHKRFGRCDNVF